MDELIKQLRSYAKWAKERPLEIPILLPVYLLQAADELEKRKAMETSTERMKKLVLSKLQEIVDDYYASGMIESFYVADYCFLIIRELLDELDAKLEPPKEKSKEDKV